MGWVATIIVIVSLVYGVNAALAWGAGEQWMAVFLAEAPPGRFAPAALVVPIVFMIAHPLIAGLLRVLAWWFGGQGDYRGMLAGYAFALVPSALSIAGLFPDPFGWLGTLFAFWTFVLIIYAIGANERFSLVRSFAVVSAPLLVVGLAATAIFALS
jgi:hypothetical protein